LRDHPGLHGTSRLSPHLHFETSLAIPIQVRERILAAVSVRFAATALPFRTAIEQFLPKMREIAGKIEREFLAKDAQLVANRCA